MDKALRGRRIAESVVGDAAVALQAIGTGWVGSGRIEGRPGIEDGMNCSPSAPWHSAWRLGLSGMPLAVD